MRMPDGGHETLRQLYALETRVLTLELHRKIDRETIDALQAQLVLGRGALWKLLIGALLAMAGVSGWLLNLLFGVVRPKLGL